MFERLPETFPTDSNHSPNINQALQPYIPNTTKYYPIKPPNIIQIFLKHPTKVFPKYSAETSQILPCMRKMFTTYSPSMHQFSKDPTTYKIEIPKHSKQLKDIPPHILPESIAQMLPQSTPSKITCIFPKCSPNTPRKELPQNTKHSPRTFPKYSQTMPKYSQRNQQRDSRHIHHVFAKQVPKPCFPSIVSEYMKDSPNVSKQP